MKDYSHLIVILDSLLIESLKLSEEKNPDVFKARSVFLRKLREFLEDFHYEISQEEKKRLHEKLTATLEEALK